MKKFMAVALCLCVGCSLAVSGAKSLNASADEKSLTQDCKSAYLCDFNSGECIYKENETERMPIASVCKVMTLTLCFEAVESGRLSLSDEITVSDRAAGMGGSQVFLQSGLSYPLSQLVKSIIVCSANDSCVAVSEAIAGNEETFVAAMNKKASELGCNDTLFANCTGLPKDTQYSCAKDVATMFSNLIRHEEYFKYSKIWLEDFAHPDDRTISMTNTNKLIRSYGACDGGKTGFTNEAGFCLASTAKKDGLRLVSAVLGAKSSKSRFDSATAMFNYGFSNYSNKIVLDETVNLSDKFAVENGKKEEVSVHAERSGYVFTSNNEKPEITKNVVSFSLKAPIEKGSVVGKVEIYKNGVICDTVKLLASEGVEKAGYGDNLKKVASRWTF